MNTSLHNTRNQISNARVIGKKSLALNAKIKLFLLVLLFVCQSFSSKAAFENAINGATQTTPGKVEDYTYSFILTPPTSFPIPVSAILQVTGGEFVFPNGTTSSSFYPTVGGYSKFQVRWYTSGRITSTTTLKGIPYVPNGGYVTSRTYFNVTVAASIPDVNVRFGGDPNTLSRNTTYTVTAENAINYEWAVSGDVSIISGGGSSITIKTGPNFTQGKIQARGQNYGEWSAWKGVDLNFACSIPTGLSIKGDGTSLSAGRIYKFYARATNATQYSWTVSCNANIYQTSGNMLQLELMPGYTTVRIGMRAKKDCEWSENVYYIVTNPTGGCIAPSALEIKALYGFKDLCFLSDHELYLDGPKAEKYHWTVTGNARIYTIAPTKERAYLENNSLGHYTTENKIWIETSNGYFGTAVNVQVTAYYCNEKATVVRYKYYNTSTSCNTAVRLGGAEEVTQEESLWPNPVVSGNPLSVKLASVFDRVEIRNINGQIVKAEILTKANEITIATRQLSKGIYLLYVHSKDGKPKIKRFSVQ